MKSHQFYLKSAPIFSDLNDQALEVIGRNARLMTFRKNSILMNEGETGECMYIIASGSVKIFVSDENGHELILYIEQPGSYLGEISLLDDGPRTASAVTLEKTQVLVIAKNDFRASIESHPDIALEIIKTMTQRLRRATEGIRSLALKNVYQRLALKLLELSVEEAGNRFLPRVYSQKELAAMIGSSREMVGKILAELVKGEYIELRDRQIYLLRHLPHNW